MPTPTPADSINTSAALKLLIGADVPMVTALISFWEKHRETMDKDVCKGWDSLLLMLFRKGLVGVKLLTLEEAYWTPPQPAPKAPADAPGSPAGVVTAGAAR
jgi:hypothetical protein